MIDAVLKTELHEWIEEAEGKQLKEIYDLMINYFNSQQSEGWDTLSDWQKNRILNGLAEAEAGLGRPAKDVIRETREKYGLK